MDRVTKMIDEAMTELDSGYSEIMNQMTGMYAMLVAFHPNVTKSWFQQAYSKAAKEYVNIPNVTRNEFNTKVAKHILSQWEEEHTTHSV